jgi:AmmeMemoRadiSam system protein B
VSETREFAVAGSFYPSSPQQLESDVKAFLESVARTPIKDDLIALVVPHAGYVYSGRVAAHAYCLLETRFFDTIVLLGPNHLRIGFKGTSVYSKGAFKTPLGEMKIDEDFSKEILSLDVEARFDPEAHAREHSLEVQIPFLQVLAPQAKIVPIVMGDDEKESCESLAHALIQSIQNRKDQKTLIVATSDLSHQHPYDQAIELDRIAIQDIETLDAQRLYMDVVENERTELCGFGPIWTALIASRGLGVHWVKTLAYANSGDLTKDRSKVVGYVSMGLFKKEPKKDKILKEMEKALLKEEESLCGHA